MSPPKARLGAPVEAPRREWWSRPGGPAAPFRLATVPDAILALAGPCGVVSAWMVLSHAGQSATAERLAEACRYTVADGTFMIALAVGLHELGLSVAFYTDTDPFPKPVEVEAYRIAEERGLPVRPALRLGGALAQVARGSLGIVCYDTPEGQGHITPLLGREGADVLLPLAPGGRLPADEFVARWSAPEILRQLVLIAA